jgi:hypothetical protein
MRKRAELLAHIQNTNSQYNLPPFGARISKPLSDGYCCNTSPTRSCKGPSQSMWD